ncbi:hypothetical protein MKX01_026497 [Papaver californicum]|nr:hypothetical protein MKX01_026497 [Papaver californicum]
MDTQDSTRLSSSSSQPPGMFTPAAGSGGNNASNSYGGGASDLNQHHQQQQPIHGTGGGGTGGNGGGASYNNLFTAVNLSGGGGVAFPNQATLNFNTTTITSNTNNNNHGNSSDQFKKKRGRPRKYTVEGYTGGGGDVALALTPLSSVPPTPQQTYMNTTHHSSEPPSKKNRGRPLGSGGRKQQLDALGSSGIAFTPHIIAVEAGEDVVSKIMAFLQQGPHAICILSANGGICNVTLRQPATFGGTVTYEGRFEIISLSGSFLLTHSGGRPSRTGGISVSLASSDGRLLGGGVAMLLAATPVQVVVGKFIMNEEKQMPEYTKQEPSFAPPHMMGFGAPVTAGSSPSQDASSGSSDEGGSPLNRVPAAFNGQSVQSMSGYSSMGGWGTSQTMYP